MQRSLRWIMHLMRTTVILYFGLTPDVAAIRIGVQASSQGLVDSTYSPIFVGAFQDVGSGQANFVDTVALTTDAALYSAAANGSMDLFYGGPTAFNCLQSEYNVKGIAAAIDIENSHDTPYLGAQIVARVSSGITNITQLAGARVAVTQLTHIVGCLAQWGEMRRHGLDLFADTKAVILANTSANVLQAVASGLADVGFLRAGTVEQMNASRAFASVEFSVVNQLKDIAFPYPVSAPLYPAVVIAASPMLDDNVGNALAIALMEQDVVNASALANISRWVPLRSYVSTQSLQIDLGVMDADLSRCYRTSTYYDSIICPSGYTKLNQKMLGNSCEGVLDCARDLYTCICSPCIKQNHRGNRLYLIALVAVPVAMGGVWIVVVMYRRAFGKKFVGTMLDASTLNLSPRPSRRTKYGDVWEGRYMGMGIEIKGKRSVDGPIGAAHNRNKLTFREWLSRISEANICGGSTTRDDAIKMVLNAIQLRHPNVEAGIAGTSYGSKVMLVTPVHVWGSLYDLLCNPTVALDTGMVMSLLHDITSGLKYLEDQGYVLDVDDFKHDAIALDENFRAVVLLDHVRLMDDKLDRIPETRRATVRLLGTAMVDMLYRHSRILSQTGYNLMESRPPENVAYRDGPDPMLCKLIDSCLTEDSDSIPTLTQLLAELDSRGHKGFGMDSPLTPTDSRNLLMQMLPVDIVTDLKMKRRPPSRLFDVASVCVLDVCYRTLPSVSQQEMQEITGSVRAICEAICTRMCLMAVQTMPGTSCFVAVGNVMSPLTNHVNVVLEFAVEAIQKISRLPTRNNNTFLRAQAGVHMGALTTVVMGNTPKRYCVLGSDVVVAAQLQQRSDADHVRVSETAANAALHVRRPSMFNFVTRSKGQKPVHDRSGPVKTLWLQAIGSQSLSSR